MAWNPSPKIADLRDFSRRWNFDQVVVLGFKTNDGTFEVLSFGKTKELCDKAARTAATISDEIAEAFLGGDL